MHENGPTTAVNCCGIRAVVQQGSENLKRPSRHPSMFLHFTSTRLSSSNHRVSCNLRGFRHAETAAYNGVLPFLSLVLTCLGLSSTPCLSCASFMPIKDTATAAIPSLLLPVCS